MATKETKVKTPTPRTSLPDAVEKKMIAAIETAFENESATWRASAVIWGRKQLKYQRGLRTSKPPIPAGLQHATNRAKTEATLEKIAAAIGADAHWSPRQTTPAATPKPATAKTAPATKTPKAAAAPAVTPDPKPTGRKSRSKAAAAAAAAGDAPAPSSTPSSPAVAA
jgi:hypothetical protein